MNRNLTLYLLEMSSMNNVVDAIQVHVVIYAWRLHRMSISIELHQAHVPACKCVELRIVRVEKLE